MHIYEVGKTCRTHPFHCKWTQSKIKYKLWDRLSMQESISRSTYNYLCYWTTVVCKQRTFRKKLTVENWPVQYGSGNIYENAVNWLRNYTCFPFPTQHAYRITFLLSNHSVSGNLTGKYQACHSEVGPSHGFNAQTEIQSHTSPCGIYSKHSGTGRGFPLCNSVSPPSVSFHQRSILIYSSITDAV
jgi:hypothetical protein